MLSVHSRIEWVWLHWSEYLLARDEFYRWFQKMLEVLEVPAELQLGLKEKQWQLSHAQVLLHNVGNEAVLLDRLLEEAASLFNRIGDPSVDEDAQKRMKAEYSAVKAKAQVREMWWRTHSSPLCPLTCLCLPMQPPFCSLDIDPLCTRHRLTELLLTHWPPPHVHLPTLLPTHLSPHQTAQSAIHYPPTSTLPYPPSPLSVYPPSHPSVILLIQPSPTSLASLTYVYTTT